MRTISEIIVHQSASSFGDARTIDAWHRQRGWSGIGYHRVVCNGHRTSRSVYLPALDGKIELGRPDEKVGAHCSGRNAHSLGICCIGDGDAFGPGGYMTRKQWAALVDACARLCQRYNIKPTQIFGHRETNSGRAQGKTCPGYDAQVLRCQVGLRMADPDYRPMLPTD